MARGRREARGSGVCARIRCEVRATAVRTTAPQPTRTLCFDGVARSGQFFAASSSAPSLRDVSTLTPTQLEQATEKTRDGSQRRWLRGHGHESHHVDRRRVPAAELRVAEEFFELLKKDEGDEIDADEICDGLNYCGMAPSRCDVRRIMREIDCDGSGHLNKEEFLTLLFDEEMRARFFHAAAHKSKAMLTVPLWSLAYHRKKKLAQCLAQYAEQVPELPASPVAARRGQRFKGAAATVGMAVAGKFDSIRGFDFGDSTPDDDNFDFGDATGRSVAFRLPPVADAQP